MSSMLGRNRSAARMVSRRTARARSTGHNRRRRLESRLTCVPAVRARSMAAKTVSQALVLIARLMPDTCRKLARSIRPDSRLAGVIRLAAEPRRR
ncbi:hypothetical protein D9M69_650670 [compost metagenome]